MTLKMPTAMRFGLVGGSMLVRIEDEEMRGAFCSVLVFGESEEGN